MVSHYARDAFTAVAFLVMVIDAECAAVSAPAAVKDSLCIHFAGGPQTVHIELKRDFILSGALPFTICDLVPGDRLRMTVQGPGFERRTATLKIGMDGVPSVAGVRLGAGIRNMLIPGWGNVFEGNRSKGWIDGLLLAGTAYMLYREHREYEHLENRVEGLTAAMNESELFSRKQSFREALHEAVIEVNDQNAHRKRLMYMSAAMYAHQVLESWLSGGPPRSTVEAGGSVITVHPAAESRFKAFVHSFIRPGRGQYYQGKNTRSVLFSVFSVTGGLMTLDMQNRYDRAASMYGIAVERYEAAATIEDRRRYMREAERLWDDVKEEKRHRNIALIATAGIWSWSMLDTLFPDLNGVTGSRLSFEWTAGGGALVMKF